MSPEEESQGILYVPGAEISRPKTIIEERDIPKENVFFTMTSNEKSSAVF